MNIQVFFKPQDRNQSTLVKPIKLCSSSPRKKMLEALSHKFILKQLGLNGFSLWWSRLGHLVIYFFFPSVNVTSLLMAC